MFARVGSPGLSRAWPWRIWLCIFRMGTLSVALGLLGVENLQTTYYYILSLLTGCVDGIFGSREHRSLTTPIINQRSRGDDFNSSLMPRKEFVLDGLWYCLCPSFSLGSLSRPGIPLIKGRRLPAPPLSQRCYSSSSNPADSDNGVEPTTRQNTVVTHSSIRPRYLARRPPQGSAGVPKTLAGQSTADLESKLQELAVRSPKVISATQILRILIRDRHVRPGVRHYRALILANTDAERGSPEVLRGLLEEMERSGIPADSGTLHAALQVWRYWYPVVMQSGERLLTLGRFVRFLRSILIISSARRSFGLCEIDGLR